jgi:acyl-CoA reductase-like NAD-dependent aldehyde dehydrogenase
VAEILTRYEIATAVASTTAAAPAAGKEAPAGSGIFDDVDSAVAAAGRAQERLVETSLGVRRAAIQAMREIVRLHNEELSLTAVEETGLGNVRDKVVKNLLALTKTPGVEDVEPSAATDENGLTLTERAPYGVIGAITPCTNPIATITSNAIGMIAAGNAVVFNVHPAAKNISSRLVSLLNDAVCAAGGPMNLLTAIRKPTLESAAELMRHHGVALLVVTGGPGVVQAAMASGKKAICAGPGNPPVVVDETADIVKAGRDIVAGAGFDNNIVCICEKEILVVESVADRLKAELIRNGAFLLDAAKTKELSSLVIAEAGGPGKEGAPNKAYVGKSPAYIARAIGVEVPDDTRILLCETGAEHPLVWTEQLMPVIPMVRMRSADEAIEFAVEVEHGFRHSAMFHSHDVDRLSKMARRMNCSLFVKNGPCFAGLGEGGAGFTSFTIASPTGEGVTRARTFTRERRCTLVGSFRIV